MPWASRGLPLMPLQRPSAPLLILLTRRRLLTDKSPPMQQPAPGLFRDCAERRQAHPACSRRRVRLRRWRACHLYRFRPAGGNRCGMPYFRSSSEGVVLTAYASSLAEIPAVNTLSREEFEADASPAN